MNKLRPLRVGALFMEMGLGKTRVMLELIALRRERITRVLWFCPVSTKETLRAEIARHAGEAAHVFDGHTAVETVPLGEFFHVIGIESISGSDRVYLAARALADAGACVVVDESSYIKGPCAKRTERITELARGCRYRYLLTGTPLTQGVIDLYAQMRFLDRRILGYKSFHAFAANHLEYSEKFPGMVVRSHNTAWLAAKIAPYIYQVTKSEALTLPEKRYERRHFEMTPAQREHYEQAKREILGEILDDEISSHTIFRLFTALQQIVSGFWKRRGAKEEEPELIEFEHARIETLRAVLAEIAPGEKVIVWAKFQRDIQNLKAALGESAALFYGVLGEKERGGQLQRWRADARELLATPACGSHGLTLNEAAYVVFYNNEFKFANRLQAEDRNHRIGQTRPVTYIDLVCAHSIDERIMQSQEKKANVVDEFRGEIEAMRGSRTMREAIKEAVGKL